MQGTRFMLVGLREEAPTQPDMDTGEPQLGTIEEQPIPQPDMAGPSRVDEDIKPSIDELWYNDL